MGVVERPPVYLDFDGPGGNTLALVGGCMKVAQKAGWTHAAIEAFRVEALSHDRDHVLDTIFEYFEVQKTQIISCEVDRGGVE